MKLVTEIWILKWNHYMLDIRILFYDSYNIN